MTREMNRSLCNKKYCTRGMYHYCDMCVYNEIGIIQQEKSKTRVLDDWIKPFFDNCCRMEKLKDENT